MNGGLNFLTVMCPDTSVLEPGHFSGFRGGIERLKSIADLLNLAPNQIAVPWRQARTVSIRTLQIANAPQKTR
jgi:hypothetical protein